MQLHLKSPIEGTFNWQFLVPALRHDLLPAVATVIFKNLIPSSRTE